MSSVSRAVVAVVVTLVLVRRWRHPSAAALLGVSAVARPSLGVDHPSDVRLALVLAVGVPVPPYRLDVPNEA